MKRILGILGVAVLMASAAPVTSASAQEGRHHDRMMMRHMRHHDRMMMRHMHHRDHMMMRHMRHERMRRMMRHGY